MTGAVWSGAPACPLAIVTGAPGSGKSSVAAALIAQRPPFLVFDADWLLDAASALAGRALSEAEESWPAYRRLWLAIAGMIDRNGHEVALFIPVEPVELMAVLPDHWRDRLRWYLLDCADGTRRDRLAARGWTLAAIDEAITDATELRCRIGARIDTTDTTATEAAGILARLIGDASPAGSPRQGTARDVL